MRSPKGIKNPLQERLIRIKIRILVVMITENAAVKTEKPPHHFVCGGLELTGRGKRIRTFACRNQNPVP
jgi:hypothetical protein